MLKRDDDTVSKGSLKREINLKKGMKSNILRKKKNLHHYNPPAKGKERKRKERKGKGYLSCFSSLLHSIVIIIHMVSLCRVSCFKDSSLDCLFLSPSRPKPYLNIVINPDR